MVAATGMPVDPARAAVLPPAAITPMPTVTLYTRRGCHLCDDAKTVLDAVRGEHPFELAVVDIDTDPALVARYTDEVPVIAVDGRKAFKYRVTAAELVARLQQSEATTP